MYLQSGHKGIGNPTKLVPKTILKKRCTMKSPTKEEDRMKLLSVEIKLLHLLHTGQSVVRGEDVHTLRQLIAKGYAVGVDASDGDGDEYIEVRLSPSGREIASDLEKDE
ncbi:hypothetical protein [Pseudomonas sp. W5-36]|uniref:hypothetical protein n=1 Tax=Pseudomonas sp. W5-36 TaxID=3097455 RepID=UPI00397CDF09